MGDGGNAEDKGHSAWRIEPQCNRLRPRGIGFAFHRASIAPQMNTRRVPGSTGHRAAASLTGGVNMVHRAKQADWQQPPNIQHAVPLVHAELLTKVLTARTRFCLLAGMRVAWLRRGTTRKAGNHTQREQELYRLHKRRLLCHAKTTLSIRMVLTY